LPPVTVASRMPPAYSSFESFDTANFSIPEKAPAVTVVVITPSVKLTVPDVLL
jgi:hypothetical protein